MGVEKKFLYEELSYDVLGCAFEAFKSVGVGRRERDVEQWDKAFWGDASVRKLIETLIGSIHNIDRALGVAYHSKIYKAAMSVELKRNKLSYDDRVHVETKIENIQFRPFEIDYWLVEKSLLFGILAGRDKPRIYDQFRMRSYLKHLHLHHGLIAY